MGCNRCITACLGQCLGHEEFKYDTCKSYLTQKKGELTDQEQHIIAKTSISIWVRCMPRGVPS